MSSEFEPKIYQCKEVFEHRNKIVRNMSDETSKAFWASAEKTAAPVKDWPYWKKGGIEVQQSGIATENTQPIKTELTILSPDPNIKGWKIRYSLMDRIKHFIIGLFS